MYLQPSELNAFQSGNTTYKWFKDSVEQTSETDAIYEVTEAGTYTVYLNAYDAGTEANDELRGSGMPGMPGMPVPPPLDPLLGMNGSGVTTSITNDTVHIHPGNIGDDSATDGAAKEGDKKTR